MEIWKNGNSEKWKVGKMIICKNGNLDPRKNGNFRKWKFEIEWKF